MSIVLIIDLTYTFMFARFMIELLDFQILFLEQSFILKVG